MILHVYLIGLCGMGASAGALIAPDSPRVDCGEKSSPAGECTRETFRNAYRVHISPMVPITFSNLMFITSWQKIPPAANHSRAGVRSGA
jgi:hypothetical protein